MSTLTRSEFFQSRHFLDKHDISIECLSYEYINTCMDADELEKIIIILRSGETGYYPNLTRHAEEKLTKIKPQSRVLRVPRLIIQSHMMKRDEKQEINNDINDWIEQIQLTERDLDHSIVLNFNESMPQSSIRKIEQVKVTKNIKKPIKPNPMKTCDYKAWDKYDPDIDLQDMNLEEEQQQFEIKKILQQQEYTEKMSKNSIVNLRTLSKIELNKIAEQEKRKGNEAFQAGDYKEALHFYSLYIKINSTVIGYNNRAITYIKLGKYQEALKDCNIVLEIEPTNIKGLLRRASVLEYLGNKDSALNDYVTALKCTPINNTATAALKRLKIAKTNSSYQY